LRQVLECGSPLPLLDCANVAGNTPRCIGRHPCLSKAAEDCRTPRRWRAIRFIVPMRVRSRRPRLSMNRAAEWAPSRRPSPSRRGRGRSARSVTIAHSRLSNHQPDMTNHPNHPNPEETIVDAALELPPEERAAYVARACGADARLRELVEALLRAHRRAAAPR